MKQYKVYENLYTLYQKRQRALTVSSLACLGITILLFVNLCFEMVDMNFELLMVSILLFLAAAVTTGLIALIQNGRAKKCLSQFTAAQLAAIDRELLSHKMQEGVVITSHAVIIAKGGLQLCPVNNVLWVYQNVMTGSLYGLIPLYKITTLVVATKDKKQYTCRVKNKNSMVEFMHAELSRYRTDILYGYEAELEKLFHKDINRLIALAADYGRTI